MLLFQGGVGFKLDCCFPCCFNGCALFVTPSAVRPTCFTENGLADKKLFS